MRVHRQVLESIFAMLNLHDLTQILVVSQFWSAAVRSMNPIGARIRRDGHELRMEQKSVHSLPPIHSLIRSPLIWHVAAIEIKGQHNQALTELTNDALALLAQHAPNLTSLWCRLTQSPPSAPLVFPAKLTSLRLDLDDELSPAEINHALSSLAALPHLQRLVLAAPNGPVQVPNLGLLAASSSLTDLGLESYFGSFYDSNDQQLAQCRSSLGHLQRLDVGLMCSARLARLLQPPVSARWQAVGSVLVDEQTGDVLLTLPTLTKLDLWFEADVPNADFLFKLPLLTTVRLRCEKTVAAESMLSFLLPCRGITELDLSCGFNSAQVSTLLATLTNLRKLTLQRAELETLQCFATGPATHTLEELELRMLETLPHPELFHLFALKRLRILLLFRCFATPFDARSVGYLSPPCPLLPSLIQFRSQWMYADQHRYQVVKRSGPSFEWMQQRLT